MRYAIEYCINLKKKANGLVTNSFVFPLPFNRILQWGAEMLKYQKQPKNTKNPFFACFIPYIEQSLNHTG